MENEKKLEHIIPIGQIEVWPDLPVENPLLRPSPPIDPQNAECYDTRLFEVRQQIREISQDEGGVTEPEVIESPPPTMSEPISLIQERQMRIRRKRTEDKIAKEGIGQLKERHIMFGDAQYPDQDPKAIGAVKAFNRDYRATHAHIMGDMLNATTVGSYEVPRGAPSFWDEIRGAREMIKDMAESLREANPDVKINYYEGNHCYRLQKFIDRYAPQLGELEEMDGEKTLAMERLLGLKELGIKWIPYWEDGKIGNHTTVLHGDKVRSKAGFTAHGYIDSYGTNAIAGHTHRLALVFRTQSGNVKFGMETGSLCKRKMKVPYMRANQADWQQGFSIMGIDQQNDAHPAVLLINKGKVAFNGKVYKGQ